MGRKKIPRGSTARTAIVVLAKHSEEAIAMENACLTRMFGPGWEKIMQCLVQFGTRRLDRITVSLGRRLETMYFDITSVFLAGQDEDGGNAPSDDRGSSHAPR